MDHGWRARRFACALGSAAALASAPAAALGVATIVDDPYGSVTVQGATLSGNVVTGWQTNVVIQLPVAD